MKIVDANVLVYAANSSDPFHERARVWMQDAFGHDETVGFSWTVCLAFLRVATRAAIFDRPLSVTEAVSVIQAWLAQPIAVIVEPTPRHLDLLAGLLDAVGVGGNLVGDAHLAALAIEHHATVVSFDNDFGRFPGIEWQEPPKLAK